MSVRRGRGAPSASPRQPAATAAAAFSSATPPFFRAHCKSHGTLGRLDATREHTQTHTRVGTAAAAGPGLAELGRVSGCGAPTYTTYASASLSLVSEVLLWRRGSSLIAKQVTGN